MTYTKFGPFTNSSVTPPINAQFLNALEQFLASTAVVNGTTGWYHCDQYGAVGDGTTDDRAAIQAALTAAGNAYTSTGARQTVYLPNRIHACGVTNYINVDGTTVNGITCLVIPDGVIFTGPGTIKVKNGSYGSGAYFRALTTKSSGSSYITINGITVDGNRVNQTPSTNTTNILIEGITEIEISDVKSLNANGNGIMVRGTTSTPVTHAKIARCRVDNASYIGIQSSQFDGLSIEHNDVSYTGDNGIDVYGENGTTNSNGLNFRIENNYVRSSSVGIFLETVASGVITGNRVYGSTSAGAWVNRINGQPNDLLITGNQFSYLPYGMCCTGDTGGVTIRGNLIWAVSAAGVRLGDGGAGNSSYINIMDNTIESNTVNSVPLVWANSPSGGTVSNIRVRGTITKNSNRSYDFVVASGTNTTANSVSAANAA